MIEDLPKARILPKRKKGTGAQEKRNFGSAAPSREGRKKEKTIN